MDAAAYARQLKHLLPRGSLWALEDGSALGKLLLAIADELARIDARCVALVEEWFPDTADETLDDWERVLGIVPEDGATDAERRLVAAAALTARGGSTPIYFVALALKLGFVTSIAYTSTHVWTMTVDLGASTSPFTVDAYVFMAGAARAGDVLSSARIPELEDAINAAKPAHTKALFVYQA